MQGGSCTTEGCGCPVSGYGAGSSGGRGGGCGCPVTGHEACCPLSGYGACPTSDGKGELCDPFANAAEVWQKDAINAIREVKMEILKEKVRKVLGPQMEKAADATWDANGAVWQWVLAQSQAALAQEGLREQLRRIFSEKGK